MREKKPWINWKKEWTVGRNREVGIFWTSTTLLSVFFLLYPKDMRFTSLLCHIQAAIGHLTKHLPASYNIWESFMPSRPDCIRQRNKSLPPSSSSFTMLIMEKKKKNTKEKKIWHLETFWSLNLCRTFYHSFAFQF